MTGTEMEEKAGRLHSLQQEINRLQAQADTLKTQLKIAMGERELVQAGAYSLYFPHIVTSRVDVGALRRTMPEVACRFTKTGVVRRFSLAKE